MLNVSDVHFTYPNATQAALAGVSFELQQGEIIGLLGPNGAGKTTLISHLAGLLPLQRGSISINDIPLTQSKQQNPTRIAIAPQEYAFYPTLSVLENLQCFAALQRQFKAPQQRARIARALAFTQLESFRSQLAKNLSGGLKRRLNLAIATLADPQFLLLDEPTVGVDPQSRAFLLTAVQQLAAEGVGIIYTSHYMEEVEAISKRVVIIDHGKVLRQGYLDELLAQGQAILQFVQTGLSAIELQQVMRPFGELDSALQSLTLNDVSTPSQALRALEVAGAKISHAEFGRFNLEQLFMQLTHRSLRD